jgi:hypothetical protein
VDKAFSVDILGADLSLCQLLQKAGQLFAFLSVQFLPL